MPSCRRHFAWDATLGGIRYVQWPRGYPQERGRKESGCGGEDWRPLLLFDSNVGGLTAPRSCYWCAGVLGVTRAAGRPRAGCRAVDCWQHGRSGLALQQLRRGPPTRACCLPMPAPPPPPPRSDYYAKNLRDPSNVTPSPWTSCSGPK